MRHIFAGLIFAMSLPALAADTPLPSPEDMVWVARPVLIFADTEADPRVARQLQMLEAEAEKLKDRDVVIIVDTDPAEKSAFRQKIRPRDFRFVLIDKDGKIVYRKPDPVSSRELIRLIDRLPSRKLDLGQQ